MVASSLIALVAMLIAFLSGAYGPTRVVSPFLVITLVLALYRCIVVALYVTAMLWLRSSDGSAVVVWNVS